jgi:hypothetical protein
MMHDRYSYLTEALKHHDTIKQLMNNVLISTKMINGETKYFRMCELELYLTDADHKDPFTHCDEQQMSNQCWYFHRMRNSYKEGTFKGLDITIGTPGVRYCGILIRSLCEMTTDGKTWTETDRFIEGPCNCVNALIDNSSVKDFLKNVTHIPMNIYSNVMDLKIIRVADLPIEEIYVGKRYGLSEKTEDPNNFRNAPYRFVTHIKKIKKQKSDLVKIQS